MYSAIAQTVCVSVCLCEGVCACVCSDAAWAERYAQEEEKLSRIRMEAARLRRAAASRQQRAREEERQRSEQALAQVCARALRPPAGGAGVGVCCCVGGLAQART